MNELIIAVNLRNDRREKILQIAISWFKVQKRGKKGEG